MASSYLGLLGVPREVRARLLVAQGGKAGAQRLPLARGRLVGPCGLWSQPDSQLCKGRGTPHTVSLARNHFLLPLYLTVAAGFPPPGAPSVPRKHLSTQAIQAYFLKCPLSL